MSFEYFSRNGTILAIGEANVPLSNIEYQYGFGVYETIRRSNGTLYFLDQHIERLLESARIIGLAHTFASDSVKTFVRELAEKNGAETCNIKILLIGAPRAEDAQLNILCLNPHFPDKKLYRDGVTCVTYPHERPFPHAKTLNMLQSYLAYRKAKEAGAYDALLLDKNGCITEGTRTNFFCIKDATLFSPPEDEILLGVTRAAVLKVAAKIGMTLQYAAAHQSVISGYDGAFLTSTSSKILPVNSIDGKPLDVQSPALRELMAAFDDFLAHCGGVL